MNYVSHLGSSRFGFIKASDVYDIRDGTHDSPVRQSEHTGFTLITSKDISNGVVNSEDSVFFLTKKDFEGINSRSLVEDGDVLMPMIGTIGNPAIAKNPNYAIKNILLIKDKGLFDRKFIYYLIQSLEFENYLEFVKGGGVQSFISLGDVRRWLIPNIPLFSQKRIVEDLDVTTLNVSNAINTLKQKLIHLDEYKTALIHNAVTKGLDAKGCRILDGTPAAEMTWKPSGVEWIGDVPDGWDVGSYDELGYINGYAYSSNFFDLEKGIPVVRIGDIGTDKAEKRYTGNDGLNVTTQKGDLLLGLSGDVKYAVWNGENSLLNQRVLSIRSSNATLINFIASCIGFCVDETMLTSTSTTIKNISLDQVKAFKYPVMRGLELRSVSDYLAKKSQHINSSKQAINKKIALLVEYKKSLINEAVSGAVVSSRENKLVCESE